MDNLHTRPALAVVSPLEKGLVIMALMVPAAMGLSGRDMVECLLACLCLAVAACLLAVWKCTSFLLAFLRDVRPALKSVERALGR